MAIRFHTSETVSLEQNLCIRRSRKNWKNTTYHKAAASSSMVEDNGDSNVDDDHADDNDDDAEAPSSDLEEVHLT